MTTQDLENKVNGALGRAFLGTAAANEYYQTLTLKGEAPYTWLSGHLSDFTGPAGMALLFSRYLKHDKDRSLKFWAGAYTLFEIAEGFLDIDGVGNFDLQDILCIWAGTILATELSDRIPTYLQKKKNNNP